MKFIYIIFALIILVNGIFGYFFIKDFIKHRASVSKEPGNPFLQAISSVIIFFFSTFGVSDFALSTAIYRKMRWVPDKKLPGTLNTQGAIPFAVMALAYMTSIQVEFKTLILCLSAQVLGAYISPRYVVDMNVNLIKKFIATGLLIAAGLILATKFGFYPIGGENLGLTGYKLLILTILSFVYGALNNIGIGSFALIMATAYALGLSPKVAFPLMMGGSALSVPVASMQFVKLNSYSRRITLLTSTIGVLGVLAAVFIVDSLNVAFLQWLVAIVIIYTSISMFMEMRKKNL